MNLWVVEVTRLPLPARPFPRTLVPYPRVSGMMGGVSFSQASILFLKFEPTAFTTVDHAEIVSSPSMITLTMSTVFTYWHQSSSILSPKGSFDAVGST